jgi:uncharacterized protein (DUF433 family)
MGDLLDLLSRPTYGFGQIDRVLGLKTGTAQRWIDGYERGGRHYDPVIRESSTGNGTATWGEFVEARLLSEYRDAGVPIIRMRPAVLTLREEFGPYPLASARMWLGEDGRDLVRRAQEEVGLDRAQWIVVARTGESWLPGIEAIVPVRWSDRAQRFKDSLIWSDGEDPVLTSLHPMSGNPKVMIDPLRGFGEPVVRNVPTEVIAELIRAGDHPEMIAELYDLSLDDVNAAVRYELTRQAA